MNMNASKVFGLLALSSLLQFVPVQAAEGDAVQKSDQKMAEQVDEAQKIRIRGRSVRVHGNKIIVRTKDAKYLASNLRSDDQGLFVLQSEVAKLDRPARNKEHKAGCPRRHQHANRRWEKKNDIKKDHKHHWKHDRRKAVPQSNKPAEDKPAAAQAAPVTTPVVEKPRAADVAP